MSEEKTPQHKALLEIQDLILALPAEKQTQVYMFAEDLRDILKDGGTEAFLALTLVSLEFAAVSAEIDKDAAENDNIIPG